LTKLALITKYLSELFVALNTKNTIEEIKEI